ncbi:MAG TPA: hypothetical protein VLM11_12440 [Streptosporangiaceae bacterium]|nr:hypothetical protein [Streptosporangiaceae bacterium]
MTSTLGRAGRSASPRRVSIAAFGVALVTLTACGHRAPTSAPDSPGGAGGPGAPGPAPFTVGGQLAAVAAASATRAWAVGSTANINPLAVGWDGASWRVRLPAPGGDKLTSPGGGSFAGIAAASGSDAWAVGSGQYGLPLIEHWNGASWKATSRGFPADAMPHAVAATSARNAWAVGAIGSRPLIAHWDGTSWRRFPSPTPVGTSSALDSVAAVGAGDAWAVGRTYTARGPIPLIERWDGTSWREVPGPRIPGGMLAGVTATSGRDVWAVGSSDSNRAIIEHWDGTSWTLSASPRTGLAAGLNAVAATSATNAWAVGWTLSPGSFRTLIERWNGARWTSVHSPAPGMLTGVAATSGTNAWAVGFWTATGIAVVERWNGAHWT